MTETKIAYDQSKPKCNTCKHYNINPKDLTSGVCKAFPPQLVPFIHPGGLEIRPLLPMMKGEDYCGHHQLKVTIQ